MHQSQRPDKAELVTVSLRMQHKRSVANISQTSASSTLSSKITIGRAAISVDGCESKGSYNRQTYMVTLLLLIFFDTDRSGERVLYVSIFGYVGYDLTLVKTWYR